MVLYDSVRQGPKSFLEHPNNTIHLANISKEKDKETLTTEYQLDGKDQVHCFIYITEQMNDWIYSQCAPEGDGYNSPLKHEETEQLTQPVEDLKIKQDQSLGPSIYTMVVGMKMIHIGS